MLLIADSGSTKTEWRFIDENPDGYRGQTPFRTAGFNPFFWTSDAVCKEIKSHLPPSVKSKISKSSNLQIFFYGAGCSSRGRKKIIYDALKMTFPSSKVSVEHDLLGAARSLFGSNPGIAVILGTGSNSCLYDGKKIIDNIPALGFVLGDEGSGADMGKCFLNALLYREVPPVLEKKFIRKFNLTKDDILSSVYNKPHPNRFLASFGKFFCIHLDNPFIKKLVSDSFEGFFRHHICKYPNYRGYPLGCVGSVGYHFKDILEEVAKRYGLQLIKTIKSPIGMMVRFHLRNSIFNSKK